MPSSARDFAGQVRRNYDLYLLLVPGLAFLALFKFVPIYGLVIAFQDFQIFRGIAGSPWVGLAHFQRLFRSEEFYAVLRNTLLISLYKVVFVTPFPIVIALLLNEVGNMKVRRTIQTIIYLPHFLSWVIVSGLFATILSATGVVNELVRALGREPMLFLVDKRFFRGVLVVSHGWKEAGWAAIVYIAAITGVDPSLYEAAVIDGAGRLRQISAVTLPSIASTIVLMFIIRLSHILQAGREQVLMMYNPAVYEVGDIIETYVYRVGLGKMDYSFSTAVGLFNSIVAFVVVVACNALSRRHFGRSIW